MLTVGKHSYGRPNIIGAEADCTIGKFCSIADQVSIFVGAEHEHARCTTFPFNPLWDSTIKGHPKTKGGVTIGNDVWIGYGAIIMSGITIGDGAVIGARALVSKDVSPYSVVAGNPAKLKKYRFGPKGIAKFALMQWWNWTDEQIREAIPYLLSCEVDKLYEYWEKNIQLGG